MDKKIAKKSIAQEAENGFQDIQLQLDLFVCEKQEKVPVKSDAHSMEYPIYALQKNKDLRVRKYEKNGEALEIIPSVLGAATVFDKDLILYCASALVASRNEGGKMTRTVEVDTVDFLKKTKRSRGGRAYSDIVEMLKRLKGTTLQTTLQTNGITQVHGFGLIENYRVVAKTEKVVNHVNEKGKTVPETVTAILKFNVTLSEWIYNALIAERMQVLTLNEAYYDLTRPIDRRLYEIARKHCGNQPLFKIGLALLGEKIGVNSDAKHFRSDIRKTIKSDALPDYRIALDGTETVVFYTRDNAELAAYLSKNKLLSWYESLEKSKESID